MIRLLRKYRKHAYRTAKVAGDAQAIMQGKFVQRLVQREAGAVSRRGLNKLVPKRKSR